VFTSLTFTLQTREIVLMNPNSKNARMNIIIHLLEMFSVQFIFNEKPICVAIFSQYSTRKLKIDFTKLANIVVGELFAMK